MAKSKSKAPKLSKADAARRKYRRDAATNAAAKEGRKAALKVK